MNVITSLTSTKKTSLEISDLKNYAQDLQPLLKAIETIAKRRKKSIAQISLNYIICKGAIPIPGSGSVAQLEDNIGAMGWRLTAAEIRMLENEADRSGLMFEGAGYKRTSEKFVGYGVEKWSLD